MPRVILGLLLLLLPTFSQAGRDPLKKVAKDIYKSIRKQNNPVVGFLIFPYHDGKISSGSSIVSERLTTHMVSYKKIRVVERQLIEKILEEQHLSEAGVLDAGTAKKLGQILGVDVLITGTLIDMGKTKTEVNARGILSQSGEVIAASQATIGRTWRDRPRRVRTDSEDEDTVEGFKPPRPQFVDDDPIRVGVPGGYYGW